MEGTHSVPAKSYRNLFPILYFLWVTSNYITRIDLDLVHLFLSYQILVLDCIKQKKRTTNVWPSTFSMAMCQSDVSLAEIALE